MPTAYKIYAQPLMAKSIMARKVVPTKSPDDSPYAVPAQEYNFLSGVLPAGLTYTNSSTTRTYFASSGLIATAAANAPIFEYNPVTLALLGMRWEMEQRTNLALQSILPGGGAAPTSWPQPIATGSSAPAASIYGNADGAVAYLQSAAAQRPFFNQNIAVSANTTYQLSYLVESVTGGLTATDCISANSPPAGATVTYSVCPANPSGTPGGVITTGELRMQIVVAGTAGTIGARIGIGCAGAVTGALQFSRPQFEAGASRSSFIPTAAAAVTRQPDVLTATAITPWYNQAEGTVVFEGIQTDATITRGMYCFSDGTASNRAFTSINAGGAASQSWLITAGVTEWTSSNLVMPALSSRFRHAYTYKLNDLAAVVNGGTVATDNTATMATLTQIRFGGITASGANPFMGYARRFQYFNTRLPNAQIQGMSRV